MSRLLLSDGEEHTELLTATMATRKRNSEMRTCSNKVQLSDSGTQTGLTPLQATSNTQQKVHVQENKMKQITPFIPSTIPFRPENFGWSDEGSPVETAL